MLNHNLGETSFICCIMLPADLKNCDFKKKQKKRILPDTTAKLFIFGLIRNHHENNYLKTSLGFGKLCKDYHKWGPCLFFFAIADLKNFS